MTSYFKIFFILAVATQVLFSCSEETSPTIDQETFNSIFDTNEFDSAYYPLDVRQTDDDGYLIMGRRRTEGDYAGTYVMKADKFGNFQSELKFGSQYVNPIGGLARNNGQYYFFCMDSNLLDAQLVKLNDDGTINEVIPVSGISYPCASFYDSLKQEFVLLGYDHVNKQTTLSTVSATGAVTHGPVRFDLGPGGEDQIEEVIINHFLQNGRKLPFLAGVTNGQYYFNGFHDYTLSLVFTDMSDDNTVQGIVYGQHDDGGMSALIPLGPNKFAAARFNFGDNYFLPNVTITTSGPSNSVDLIGKSFPELVPNATVKILKANIAKTDVLIYASDTKSKQIGLFFYDEATGEFISSKYLGFSNPFEVASIHETNDGGLVVCGTTYLAGRFPRICLFKISKKELSKQVP
jgi:hypothetical protein